MFNQFNLKKRSTMSKLILWIFKNMDESDSIFFTIKLIFWIQKTTQSIKKLIIKLPTQVIDQMAGLGIQSFVLLTFQFTIFDNFELLKRLTMTEFFSLIFQKDLSWWNWSHQYSKKIVHEQIRRSASISPGLTFICH